jgi:hypothetical protein
MAARNLKVSDNVAKKLRDIVQRMGGGSVSVGFLEGATYPDGTPVAAVAFWNEFGTTRTVESADGEPKAIEHTPARPFFRGMISKESPSWPGRLAQIAKATKFDGPRSLALMGASIEGDLKKSINDFSSPENAPSTIKRKGFNKPLIDKAIMVNSTGYEVKE